MSTFSKMRELENKHDGPIPKDDLRAALKSQQEAWGEARYWQRYYEARLMLMRERIEKLGETERVQPYADKVEFFIAQINQYRAKADALDWQADNATLGAGHG